jgi:tetratricopeptide (TPR) repeat protein
MPEITETTLGFPLKGTLRRSPFSKIVRQLARIKSTGSLYLLNGKTKKVVFFDRGEPISVRSNVTAECLGQVLAREGLITQAQCDQTLESIRRTGKKQGELLVEMGILSEGNLRYGLEAQLRNKLYDVFSWDDGRYQYKPDVQGDDYGLRLSSQAQGLIVSALLETADEAYAKQSLEPFKDRFPLVDNNTVKLEVTPEEEYFLSCLDGSQSIGELLSTPSDPAPPSTVLLLYAAIQAGIAKLAKSRRQPRERAAKPTDGRTRPDSQLTPNYKPNGSVTSYEDTPLPGQLPKAPEVHLETDDDFDDVSEPSQPVLQPAHREISSVLIAAERDAPDETFDDDVDLSTGEAEQRFDEEDDSESGDADAGVERDGGQPLVADSAESGVFERVLLDDDDDQPFDPDAVDDGATVSLDAVTSEVDVPTVQVDAVREPTTLLQEPAPEPQPRDEVPPSQLDTLPAEEPDGPAEDADEPAEEPDEPDEDADEIEELDELEEVEELDELDEEEEPRSEGTDPLASAPVIAAPSGADGLAALAADLEVDDDLAMADVDSAAVGDPSAELMGLDELDDLELGDAADIGGEADGELGDGELGELGDDVDLDALGELDPDGDDDFDPEATAEADAETIGALQFGDGETAMAEGRWEQAIAHMEAAYELGLDIAELHTYLAWARFQASGQSPDMANHALELLYYAEDMNPNLAMIYAYRSAVLLSQGDHAGAQDAAQRALDIDPYDELAIDVMDKLV